MKRISIYILLLAVAMFTVQACGESEEERQAREQARLDSLRQVEQARIDSLMQARQDSIADSEAGGEEAPAAGEGEEMSTASGQVQFAENGSYAVQVGAWRSEEKANSFIQKWSDRNYPSAYVVKYGNEETGDVWFRVRVGFFNSKADAEKLGGQLGSEINTGYWVSKVR